jgi:membrane protein implicated in regulation of membrane protease activity
MEILSALEPWHWLSLGMLILIGEVLGAGGFLLGIGVSALAVAAILALFPNLPWYWQSLIFAFLSVALTLIYWKKFRKFNHKTEQPLLNARTARLVGRRVSLLMPVQNGFGKVQIEDALWTVTCDEDLAQGSIVDVIGADEMTLIVKPYQKAPDL